MKASVKAAAATFFVILGIVLFFAALVIPSLWAFAGFIGVLLIAVAAMVYPEFKSHFSDS